MMDLPHLDSDSEDEIALIVVPQTENVETNSVVVLPKKRSHHKKKVTTVVQPTLQQQEPPYIYNNNPGAVQQLPSILPLINATPITTLGNQNWNEFLDIVQPNSSSTHNEIGNTKLSDIILDECVVNDLNTDMDGQANETPEEKKKRIAICYSLNQIRETFDLYDTYQANGEFKELDARHKTAFELGINFRTFSGWLKERDIIEERYRQSTDEERNHLRGRMTGIPNQNLPFYYKEELMLKEILLNKIANNERYNCAFIRSEMLRLVEESGAKAENKRKKEFTASSRWLTRYLTRHNMKEKHNKGTLAELRKSLPLDLKIKKSATAALPLKSDGTPAKKRGRPAKSTKYVESDDSSSDEEEEEEKGDDEYFVDVDSGSEQGVHSLITAAILKTSRVKRAKGPVEKGMKGGVVDGEREEEGVIVAGDCGGEEDEEDAIEAFGANELTMV